MKRVKPEHHDENKGPASKVRATHGLGYRSPLSPVGLSNMSLSVAKPFKVPTFKGLENQKAAGPLLVKGPLHDPNAPGCDYSIYPEQLSDMDIFEASKLKKLENRKPHQVEGVHFLYECVTGNKAEDAFGCIMADEMGLGKTLHPEPGKPTIEKVFLTNFEILVKNWGNELVKWLGADQTTAELENFVSSKGRAVTRPVLIISYESLRLYSHVIGKTEIGLMLCDEGKRSSVENSDSQTYQSLNGLLAKRRVILSGTPIQNKATSEAKLQEMLSIANKFIIRRTADLLTKFLPVKFDYVVFCKLSELQMSLYKHFRESPELKRLLNGADSQPLKAITLLKKLCNHPALVYGLKEFGKGLFPKDFSSSAFWPEASGKLHLLFEMLEQIKQKGEKIVLISNYTQRRRYGVLRLDGSLSIAKRQKLVDRFNDPTTPEFVFLLSSKAGGCGINLVGANRLVLFDPDWNPANDAQKICYIYRFIATGSIEEKIFQRQAHKQSLSNCVVDEEVDVERHFSLDSLRKLFQLNETTNCDTHDAFHCKRCVKGRQTFKPRDSAAGALGTDTSNWNHFSEIEFNKTADQILKDMAKKTGTVSFLFENKSHDEKPVVKLPVKVVEIDDEMEDD
ncbi:P-loop containing nucleoside triphosphate hydrolase protein [Chytridium lagenaria]|nr:P-loop containing nucleoside triphosphate hydrolase protein [Chytridium lagenaria]